MEAFVSLELVGRGTTGVAHRVRRRSDGRILVVKRIPLSGLDETKRATMQSEASCLQRIRHPSVVGFVDSFIHDNVLHLVMEDAGRDFGMWLKARAAAGCPPTDEEFIWRAVIQVASGLSAMHGARVLHRDIKPDNIFTDERGVVKIGDLGLGRIMSEQSHQATSSVGTPLYFSPEMCEERPYGPKSDVWALGCFLYELATGRPPFLASNQLALARRILHSPVPPLPARYSPELAFLAVKLLEKDASLRPTAQQIL
ncbi:hypothetical protein EMIHUDRAFT_76245, partial [Emiliania huxleyi CCMP1516]|uniref:non-specific serine/threonine protein kinase n=2 Tax=Emiliania huxleyi TaxID=2903 RepID=A0A0D3IVF6_EMIH1